MFEKVSDAMKNRMEYLEKIDEQDRKDGTSRMERLRQIPPETGKFIAMMAANCPKGRFVEVGTSAGYSSMWIVLACMERNVRLTTFEILQDKAKMAKETFCEAQIEDFVELVQADALEYLEQMNNIAFAFLDAEKEVYAQCYEQIIPRLVPGGILIADNAINHYETLEPMIKRALNDSRVDALVVPIGKGELVCRKN
ncbi:O-methyltransferase [Vallitaleaceae bacterium 9-2]